MYFDDEAAVGESLRAYYPERLVGEARVTLFCMD